MDFQDTKAHIELNLNLAELMYPLCCYDTQENDNQKNKVKKLKMIIIKEQFLMTN